MPSPARPRGGIQVLWRTWWGALGNPWDRYVHPRTLTTTNPHTYTNLPHVDCTVRLVDLATEIGGTSSASAPLAPRVGALADFPDSQLRVP